MEKMLTATPFVKQIKMHGTPAGVKKNQRIFKGVEYSADNQALCVPRGTVFQFAKEFFALSRNEMSGLIG